MKEMKRFTPCPNSKNILHHLKNHYGARFHRYKNTNKFSIDLSSDMDLIERINIIDADRSV